MKYFFALIFLLGTQCTFAQSVFYGTYYFLPKAKDGADKRLFYIREIKISAHRLEERYVRSDFAPLTEEEAEPVSYVIDTILKRGNLYYAFSIVDNHYQYIVYRPEGKVPHRRLYARANNFKTSYTTLPEAIAASKNDTLTALEMPFFSSAEMKGFLKLKPFTAMSMDNLKSVLKKIAASKQKERTIRKNLSPEANQLYHVHRFYDISQLYFFVQEGFSPLISGEDYESLRQKFKATYREMRELLDATEK